MGRLSVPYSESALSEKKENQPVEVSITLPKEESHVPLWPWEEQVISEADYQHSLDGLNRFVEEPHTPQTQQVFADLLKDALRTLTAVGAVLS